MQAQVEPAVNPHQTVPDNAFSKHDALKELLDFNRQTLVEAYKQFGVRDASWDQAAIDFLELFAVGFTYNSGSNKVIYIRGPVEELQQKLRPEDELVAILKQTKCKDPLVLYLIGAHIASRGGDVESINYYISSYDRFKDTEYPVYRKYSVANRLMQSTHVGIKMNPQLKQQRVEWLAAYKAQAIQSLKETDALESFTLRDNLIGLIYGGIDGYSSLLETDQQAAFLLEMAELLEPLRNDQEWVYHAVKGLLYVDLAWVYRGGGFAHGVGPDQWRKFEAYLKEANENLKAAWAIEPTSLVANEMIKIAMAGHADAADNERVWFERSNEILFDDLFAWDNIISASHPKWGGSYDQMYELAMRCVNTGRFDTAVPYLGASLLMTIEADSGRDDYWKKPRTLDAMQRLTHGMAACELRAHEDDSWFVMLRAAFMWKGQDYARAQEALNEVDPLDETAVSSGKLAFARVSGDYHDAVGEIHAMASPHRDDVSAVLADVASGSHQQAKARINDLLQRGNWHPRAIDFLQAKLRGIEFQRAFASGKWIHLDGKADWLKDWRPVGGTWELDEQGRLVGTADSSGLTILHKHKIAGPYALACDAEVIGVKRKSVWSNVGLIGRYEADADLYGFWVFPNDNRIGGDWHSWFDTRRRGFVKPGLNRLKISHRADRMVKIIINDKRFHQLTCHHLGDAQSFGFSAQHKSLGRGRSVPSDFEGLKVRYSNIRIRSFPDP